MTTIARRVKPSWTGNSGIPPPPEEEVELVVVVWDVDEAVVTDDDVVVEIVELDETSPFTIPTPEEPS
jgi:hypothetical protein